MRNGEIHIQANMPYKMGKSPGEILGLYWLYIQLIQFSAGLWRAIAMAPCIVEGEEGQLSDEVNKWLGPFCANVLRVLLCQLRDLYPEWNEIVRKAITQGIAVGRQLLQNIKSSIIEFYRENPKLLQEIARFGTKTVGRAAADVVAKETVKVATRAVLKTTGKTIVKVSLNPVGIAADFTQEGLEMTGYKNAGKTVGSVGNISSGAVAGFLVGGPLGAAVGALTGAVLWGAGEVAVKLVETNSTLKED